MKINNYDINISEDVLDDIIDNKMMPINLINQKNEAFTSLDEGDKKALLHLVAAGEIINDVSLELDHPLNLAQKQALVEASKTSDYAKKTLVLFNSLNGVCGLNGVDKEPVEIFSSITGYKGKNFYPTDMSVEEFHAILEKMFDDNKISEIKNILSARTMVRRSGAGLEAIDYTVYFEKEFSKIANELEVASCYATDAAFKDYLKWQVQALLQNDEELDAVADKHWAVLQDCDLEFTLSRENYDDEMTPTIFDNKVLFDLIEKNNIEVNSKDMLGIRVGINNKKGTELILKFKEQMSSLAGLMPYCDTYDQSISDSGDVNQTMVDADLVGLYGDYAQCRGGITTAQNLPNNDKLSIKQGGGRRNVYHRQVRHSVDKNNIQKKLDAWIAPELHQYHDEDSDHLFVIGHENGHSLGPNSNYQTALGVYKHIIEEHKADVISIAFMPEYVKSGVITELQLKQIYVTWFADRLFLKAEPNFIQPHRIADLMQFNYLIKHKAVIINKDGKFDIDFDLFSKVVNQFLDETIKVQLSKSPACAKEFIDKHSNWGEVSKKIAQFLKDLGLKPYKQIKGSF